MSTVQAPSKRERRTSEVQFATFYVGDILLGIDIRYVQEINRQLAVTRVPHAPPEVRGVINLRGDVATVIDLRRVLDLPPAELTRDSRNLIVNFDGESIGLLVDRISDILTISEDQIEPPPANVSGLDGRLLAGVHTMKSSIVVLLDIEQALSDSHLMS
ncbi:MAG: purine-binding chemotaxis protein CheW [Pirellulales bacterium]|nr:purine-binding chemotaxis protein CheW [Pirellulales bacterium]